MSARTPQKTENRPARKKLHLSKETLRDLTDAKGSPGEVKGGAVPKTNGCMSDLICTRTLCVSCVGCDP